MNEIMEAGTEWTSPQLQYIEWKANPFGKEPPTQELLATELGVAPVTLWRWSQIDGFDDAVTARSIELVKSDVPKLLRAGVKHALNGKYQYWAALMRMAGLEVDGHQATDNRTQIAITFGNERNSANFTVDASSWSRQDNTGPEEVQRGGQWAPVREVGSGSDTGNE